ncbi:hypothetical protein AB6A40_000744 [Gnathostoma spinigerum]|uniref:R3H domain-containing protein n=1 Tax=Gnathostoma spinigerum TaxID=75299 RepID=A0ABD6E3P3_9BILA
MRSSGGVEDVKEDEDVSTKTANDESQYSQFRNGKQAKLTKQDVVDDEDCVKVDRTSKLNGECSVNERKPKELAATSMVDESSALRAGDNCKSGKVPFYKAPRPKVLVRSEALCKDDEEAREPRNRYPSSPGSHSFRSDTSLICGSANDSYTDSTGIDLCSFITNTLHKNMKDRQMLLQLEEHMYKLVMDPTRHSEKFPAMSSYNRMLVHRVAAFFGLDHNVDQTGAAVVVNKKAETRIPKIRFASLIQSNIFTDERRRYFRRSATSYEEGYAMAKTDAFVNRRAHSFEIAGQNVSTPYLTPFVDYTYPSPVGMPYIASEPTPARCADFVYGQVIESQGNFYPTNDVSYVGMYPTSDINSVACLATTAQAPRACNWSSSESYTSYESSVELSGSTVSPGSYSPSRASYYPTCGGLETANVPYTNVGIPKSVIDWRQAQFCRSAPDPVRHRSNDSLVCREPSIPEGCAIQSTTRINSEDIGQLETQVYLPSQHSLPIHRASSYGRVDLTPTHLQASSCPSAVYSASPSSCYATNILPGQMDSMNILDQAEYYASQPYVCAISPCYGSPVPPQSMTSPQIAIQHAPHLATVYQNAAFMMSVPPQAYVITESTIPCEPVIQNAMENGAVSLAEETSVPGKIARMHTEKPTVV